jgi:hypothetical protein
MNMAQVVRRLTLPLATTSQQFFFVLRHFPYTGGCTLRDLDGFLAAAIRCCDGGHAAQKRQALTILSGITGLHGVARGFPLLDIYQVVYELTLRVLDPKRIDQGAFGLCGPAALATLLAKTEPVTYIQLAVELLTTGRSHVRGFSLTPGEEIQRYRPSGTPQADWLVLASLRSSDQFGYNWFLANQTREHSGHPPATVNRFADRTTMSSSTARLLSPAESMPTDTVIW